MILGIRRKTLPLHRAALGRYVFIGLFGTMLPSTTSYTAAIHLPAGVSSILISLAPLVSLLMAISIGLDRATVTKVAGLGLGLAGVLLLTVPKSSLPDPTQSLFLLLVFLSVIFYATENVGLGWLGRAGLDPIQMLAGALVVAVLLALPLALLTGTFIMPPIRYGVADVALVLSGFANAVA
jgi:drug/metabolite transporter (DMT)-like permease